MTHEILVRDVAAGRVTSVSVGAYPDGSPLVDWRGIDSFESVKDLAILLRPRSLLTFYAALFLVDALQSRRCRSIDLLLPLVPGCRQDRANDKGDYLTTLASVARAVNARDFRSVTILDPHSDVASSVIHKCRVVHAADVVSVPRGKYAAVIAPDGGAEKRAQRFAVKLGVPLVHAWKTRDVGTGGISGFGLEPNRIEPGALALVVDDICDAGGTFLGLADVLDAAGVKAHLWVTHGLFTKGTAPLLSRYGHIYCSDSTFGPREGVIETSACESLLKGI